MTKHWTFEDRKIAEGFDAHVKAQLPWYDLVTQFVVGIVENYLPEGGLLYDIGASTGNITRACGDLINERNARAISVEKSKEMCGKWRGVGDLVNKDVVLVDFSKFDVAVVYLTAMFLTVEKREGLLTKLYAAKKSGAVIILVDKFCDISGYPATVLRRLTMRQKLKTGHTAEEILVKDLSLSGVQRPMSVGELNNAVQFFQLGEFSGYLI